MKLQGFHEPENFFLDDFDLCLILDLFVLAELAQWISMVGKPLKREAIEFITKNTTGLLTASAWTFMAFVVTTHYFFC